MTMTQIIQRLIKNILRIVFVYGVVGQMHTHVIYIIVRRQLVFLGCEPHQPLVIDVQAERVATCNQSINPHIELKTLIEKRAVNIVLHHALPIPLDFSQ